MLKPDNPPGDGRSYCEGNIYEIARYILERIIRAQKKGKPCHIASSVAAKDLSISVSTWYRYTRLLELAGLLRRTENNRGPLPGGNKNPGARYHYISRTLRHSRKTPALFLYSSTSESSRNPSPRRRQTAAEKVLPPSAVETSVESPLTPTPSPVPGGRDVAPKGWKSLAELELLISREVVTSGQRTDAD